MKRYDKRSDIVFSKVCKSCRTLRPIDCFQSGKQRCQDCLGRAGEEIETRGYEYKPEKPEINNWNGTDEIYC